MLLFLYSGQIYEQGRPESPTSTAMSRYDAGPRNIYGPRGRPVDSRRNLTEKVQLEVAGQLKGKKCFHSSCVINS